MKTAEIKCNAIYRTPCGFHLHVMDIDWAKEELQYQVVRGSNRNPIDFIGKIGEKRIGHFARFVEGEVRRGG